MKTGGHLKLRLCLGILLFTGCVQEPEKSAFHPKPFNFAPKNQDTFVVWSDQLTPQLGFSSQVPTRNYFSTAERLIRLGDHLNQSQLKELGQNLYLGFYDPFYSGNDKNNTVEIKLSPYVELLVANTHEDVLRQSKGLDDFFIAQQEYLNQIIDLASEDFDWPNETTSLTSTLNTVELYLLFFAERLRVSEVDPAFKNAIRKALIGNYLPRIQNVQKEAKSLGNNLSLSQSIEIVHTVIDQLEITVDKNLKQQLLKTGEIAQTLDLESPRAKDLFRVAIAFWQSLEGDDKRRKEAFPKELYKYLKKRSPSSIECLGSKKCSNLILRFIRKHFIYPKFKKFGLERIQNEMNRASAEFVAEEVGRVGAETLVELPALIKEKMATEFNNELQRLLNIRNNYPEFFKEHAEMWYEKKFGRLRLYAMEPRTTHLKPGSLEVKPQPLTSLIHTSPSAVGASAAAFTELIHSQQQFLNLARPVFQLMLMSRVNQMIAIGGFTDSEGNNFRSLSLGASLTHKKMKHLNILNTSSISEVFAFPDLLETGHNFWLQQDMPFDVSVIEQAHLLKGMASLVQIFHDWRLTSYDPLLSHVQAKDLLSDLPDEIGRLQVFPKEPLLAVALANAANILRNIRRPGGPGFQLCVDGSFKWLENASGCNDPSAIAGVVDILNGNRVKKVRAKATAKYLLSVIHFLEVTKEIERTQSEHLRHPRSKNITPLEELKESREELKLLAIGMANLLSNQLQSPNGAIYNQVSLKNGEKKNDRFSNLDSQLLSIQALLKTYELTGIRLYESAALDIYFHMNKSLWNSKTNFYSSAPNLYNVVLGIETLSQLKAHLPLASQAHIDRFISYWSDGASAH